MNDLPGYRGRYTSSVRYSASSCAAATSSPTSAPGSSLSPVRADRCVHQLLGDSRNEAASIGCGRARPALVRTPILATARSSCNEIAGSIERGGRRTAPRSTWYRWPSRSVPAQQAARGSARTTRPASHHVQQAPRCPGAQLPEPGTVPRGTGPAGTCACGTGTGTDRSRHRLTRALDPASTGTGRAGPTRHPPDCTRHPPSRRCTRHPPSGVQRHPPSKLCTRRPRPAAVHAAPPSKRCTRHPPSTLCTRRARAGCCARGTRPARRAPTRRPAQHGTPSSRPGCLDDLGPTAVPTRPTAANRRW